MDGKSQEITVFYQAKMNSDSFLGSTHSSILDNLHLLLVAVAVILIIIEIISRVKKLPRIWKTRHLRKVWGIKKGDYVIVVCSELEEGEQRQQVEPREFIYNLKYGDVDAYFEVIITLLRLYPDIKLRIVSAGEGEKTRIDMTQHLILIGGPDYNSFTARILSKRITQYKYKSPTLDERSLLHPNEIVLYDLLNGKEFYEDADEKDYGYFERIKNPDNPEKNIIIIGGCHAIGVTGAVRAFSMAESEQGETPRVVVTNAKKVAKKISRKSEFSVLVNVERVAQTINTPIVNEDNISLR